MKLVTQNVNTKKEIKEGIANLKAISSLLNTEEVSETFTRVEKAMEIRHKEEPCLCTIKKTTKEISVQTENQEYTLKDIDIREKIDKAGELNYPTEDVFEIVNQGWSNALYSRTGVEKGAF